MNNMLYVTFFSHTIKSVGGGGSSYQAVENKAKRQKHPAQCREYGAPREHCGPTPARTHCRALLKLSARHCRHRCILAHLELGGGEGGPGRNTNEQTNCFK